MTTTRKWKTKEAKSKKEGRWARKAIREEKEVENEGKKNKWKKKNS